MSLLKWEEKLKVKKKKTFGLQSHKPLFDIVQQPKFMVLLNIQTENYFSPKREGLWINFKYISREQTWFSLLSPYPMVHQGYLAAITSWQSLQATKEKWPLFVFCALCFVVTCTGCIHSTHNTAHCTQFTVHISLHCTLWTEDSRLYTLYTEHHQCLNIPPVNCIVHNRHRQISVHNCLMLMPLFATVRQF